VVEACCVLVILYGVVRAFVESVLCLVLGRARMPPTRIRLDLGRALALGLEFLLAADILETIVAPSLQQVAILGVVAIIRTGLNYFLAKEIEQEQRELDRAASEEGARPVPAEAVASPSARD
jgi:uncharacterized membrane protein